ncbi:MAG TPA: hypothetical protein VJG83_03480 [archaeon]|nr:hypothetical protein [archaeon]
MNYFVVVIAWDDYKKTLEYVGFSSEMEMKIISLGDRVVYFSEGLIAGIFEAESFCKNEFSGWQKELPFQIKLRPLLVPEKDFIARPLKYKVQLEKSIPPSSSLYKLSEQEFSKISLGISQKKKELVF